MKPLDIRSKTEFNSKESIVDGSDTNRGLYISILWGSYFDMGGQMNKAERNYYDKS